MVKYLPRAILSFDGGFDHFLLVSAYETVGVPRVLERVTLVLPNPNDVDGMGGDGFGSDGVCVDGGCCDGGGGGGGGGSDNGCADGVNDGDC